MTKDQLLSEIVVAVDSNDFCQIDAVCLKWLKQASKDYGVNISDTVVKLLDIVEGLMQ